MTTAQRESVAAFVAGTHRTRRPAETWRLAGKLFGRCGISRVADVTGLDVLGIPTWVAVRPLASTLSVSQGKGATHVQAKVSASMEAIELWYAENAPTLERGPRAARAAELALPYDFAGLQRAARSLVTEATPLAWVPAGIIGQDRTALVPEACVTISSMASAQWSPPLLRVSSNGLASGNCAEEAALHALFELVERDSTADLGRRPAEDRDYVDPSTVDDPGCAELIGRIREAGVWLELVDNTRDPGFPCYVAYLWSPEDPSVYSGSGCHSDPGVALSRAITEAAQSRLTVINGTRDDVRGSLYRSHRWDTTAPVTPPDRVRGWHEATARVAGSASAGPGEKLRATAGLVSRRTGQPVLSVALSAPDEPLAVVRVIAPGLRFGTGDECPRPVRSNGS
jgi:ribosomal protein S12 methylthiotransferase accessory factor